VFYDLDTPVTLDGLRRGGAVPYIGERGLADFDLVLSFTGGEALTALRETLGARRVAPLYGSVDPAAHFPVAPVERYRGSLSYLGTYAEDRQRMLAALLLEPARARPERRFVIGGASYPQDFPWLPNVYFVQHLPPAEHPGFFCSSPLTLNVTRRAMAEMGYCPSGRLFEAAACGTAILSDGWEGIERFFTPGEEILVARDTADALAAVELSDDALARAGRRGRERALAEHTADHRAVDLERALELVSEPADDMARASPASAARAAHDAAWSPDTMEA
jgi:spore maturation protein CgeB